MFSFDFRGLGSKIQKDPPGNLPDARSLLPKRSQMIDLSPQESCYHL